MQEQSSIKYRLLRNTHNSSLNIQKKEKSQLQNSNKNCKQPESLKSIIKSHSKLKKNNKTFQQNSSLEAYIKKIQFNYEDDIESENDQANLKKVRFSQKALIFASRTNLNSSPSRTLTNSSRRTHLLYQMRGIVQQISKKLQIIKNSQFSERELIQWIQQYCSHQKIILRKIFLKSHEINQDEIRVETCIKKLLHKLERKHRDSALYEDRFISLGELKKFNSFIQNLYKQKSQLRYKQIQRDMESRLENLCETFKKNYNYDSKKVHAYRHKPNELLNLIQDYDEIEQNNGSYQQIAQINLNRYKALNLTEKNIQEKIQALNEEIYNERNVKFL